MEVATFTAQTSGGADPDGVVRPVTADEIWDFIAHGIAKADSRLQRPLPPSRKGALALRPGRQAATSRARLPP